LNKKVDENTVSERGFHLSVNGETRKSGTASLVGEQQIKFSPDTVIVDTDELKLSYDGGELSAEDGSALEVFESLPIQNNLPHFQPIPGKIEAEDFSENHGLQLESTTDTGGGQNIGYTNAGDYLDYRVNVIYDGEYSVKVRVACNSDAGKLQFEQIDSDGKSLNQQTIDVPVTGGWQNWQTVTGKMNLDIGRTTLRLNILDPEFNVNWFEFQSKDHILEVLKVEKIQVYPNPAEGYLQVKMPNGVTHARVQITTLDGRELMRGSYNAGEAIGVSDLKPGVYILNVHSDKQSVSEKIIIK